jgi:predicted HTH domain antitoxin
MAVQVTLELPEDVFSILRVSPEAFVQELRVAAAIKWYERGMISQGKAAELAGVSRSAFIDALARYEVSPFQVTPEELVQELARD